LASATINATVANHNDTGRHHAYWYSLQVKFRSPSPPVDRDSSSQHATRQSPVNTSSLFTVLQSTDLRPSCNPICYKYKNDFVEIKRM